MANRGTLPLDRETELREKMNELEMLKEKKRILDKNDQARTASSGTHVKKATKKKAKAKPKAAKNAPVKKSPVAKKVPKKKAVPKKPKAPVKKSPVKKATKKKEAAKKPKAAKRDDKPKRTRRRSRMEPIELTDEEQIEDAITDEEIANFQVGKANMEQLINKVCEILSGGPSGGTLQSDVWRRLKLTLSDGFRLALKLEWLGLITREKVLENGRWTYRLILKRTPISTRSIVDAPCLTCKVEQKCTPEGEVSPHTCDLIRDWVIAESKRSRRRG